MLQLHEGAICESPNHGATVNDAVQVTAFGESAKTFTVGTIAELTTGSTVQQCWPYTTYWQSYPVYICTDKTAKAIEVLKALQSEKLLKCDSVPRFIQLVEKIAGLL